MTISLSAREPLPQLYDRWFAELLPGPIPRESRSTCDQCAMVKPASGPSTPQQTWFNPRTKCCTYQPVLPNFLVGQILRDPLTAASARRALVDRAASSPSATPLGIEVGPVQAHLYQIERTALFGRSSQLVCPFLTDGKCGIWQNRNWVCATWFCKYVRGAVGHRFWQSAGELLKHVELKLSVWIAKDLGVSDRSIQAILRTRRSAGELAVAELLDTHTDSNQEATWGEWSHRECEYYERAASSVVAMSMDEVIARCGVEADIHASAVRLAYDALVSDGVSQRLVSQPLRLVPTGGEWAAISYSEYDPLVISTGVVELLSRFDGRPTVEVLAEIARETGEAVPLGLVRQLSDYGLLQERGEPSPPPPE